MVLRRKFVTQNTSITTEERSKITDSRFLLKKPHRRPNEAKGSRRKEVKVRTVVKKIKKKTLKNNIKY